MSQNFHSPHNFPCCAHEYLIKLNKHRLDSLNKGRECVVNMKNKCYILNINFVATVEMIIISLINCIRTIIYLTHKYKFVLYILFETIRL